jgi:hypothetical protein
LIRKRGKVQPQLIAPHQFRSIRRRQKGRPEAGHLFPSQGQWQLAIDEDRCLQILEESGLLRKGPIGMLNFLRLPHGLNVEETERCVRENAADICGGLGSLIKVDPRANPASVQGS